MDSDRCMWRRMFAPLQAPYYRVMGANSLKQMETRGHICMPKGMRNAESMSSNNFVVFLRRRRWKTNSGMVYSAGKRKKLQSGCTKRSTSTSGPRLQSVPRVVSANPTRRRTPASVGDTFPRMDSSTARIRAFHSAM